MSEHQTSSLQEVSHTLREICLRGLDKRGLWGEREEQRERVERELQLLEQAGLTEDFLQVAQLHRNPSQERGRSRLNGAGSCSYLAYLREMTDIDPLRYDLPAERFFVKGSPLQFTFVAESLPESAHGHHSLMIGTSRVDFLPAAPAERIPWEATKLIRERGVDDFRLWMIPFDDAPTWRSLTTDSAAVLPELQRESLRELVQELQPQTLVELAAINSLEMIELTDPTQVTEFKTRWKSPRIPQPYGPVVAKILKPTRGMALFQEQILLMLSRLSELSLSEAYQILKLAARRETPHAGRDRFLATVRPQALRQGSAEELFEELIIAATFAVCQAHQLSLVLRTYQTAYLQQHYPVEFQRALGSIRYEGGWDVH